MADDRGMERLLASRWRWLLLPFWLLFRPLNWLRNLIFDLGIRKPATVEVPVICVGNLSAGGTGKTPVVAWLCRELTEMGYNPMVISRGYRGDGEANDEAKTMAVPVHCHPRRVVAARAAIAAGADILVMDDGFQHRQLARTIDLVCIDATRPVPAWHQTLPLGLLREGPAGLRRARAIIITRSDQAEAAQLAAVQALAERFGKPFIRARHAASSCTDVATGAAVPLERIAEGRMLLVSGLGNPEAFERTALELGASLVGHVIRPDHHHYSRSELDSLRDRAIARGASILTTTKDAVKWVGHVDDWPAGLGLILAIELALAEDCERLLRNCLKEADTARQEESADD